MNRCLTVVTTLGFVLAVAAPVLADKPRELDGTWIEIQSQPVDASKRDPVEITIRKNSLVESHGGQIWRQSLFKKVPDRPQAIDFVTEVYGEFWSTRAIFKIENDVLTINESDQDKPRPTDFQPVKPFGGNYTPLRTFKRAVEPEQLTASGLKVGDQAPEVVALLADGSPYVLDDSKGKVVLLTFWSDQVSVSKHFAAMRDVRKEFRQVKNFQMVSVYREGEFEDWLQFVCKQPALDDQPFYSDSRWWHGCLDGASRLQNPFRVGKQPHSFIIGADGRIIAVDLADKDVRDAVSAALKKP